MADDSFRVRNTLVVNGAFVANSTVVNAAAVTATSVNATTLFVNGVNVNTVITGNAATAYTNAIAIASNATNLTLGTVPTARLPTSSTSQAGIVQLVDSVSCTSITVAATANSVKAVYDYATTIAATGTPPSGSNTQVQFNNSGAFGGTAGLTFTTTSNTVAVGNGGSVSVGNASVNSVVGQGSITINGVNVNTAITGNAATAYTNAVTISANADNITNGVLPMPRLAANVVNTTGAFTISGIHTHTANIMMGNTTVNTQHSNATILISNNTTTTTLGLADIRIGNTTTNTVANSTAITTGNSTVNTSVSFGTITLRAGAVTATVNSSVYNGTANNAAFFNGEPASFYANASNITTGTLPMAQIGAAVVNTSGNFTVAGNINFTAANVNFANVNVGANVDLTSTTLFIGNTSVNTVANSTTVATGNTTVNTVITAGSIALSGATINATNYSGTANNANNLGGTAASDYARLSPGATFTGAVGISNTLSVTGNVTVTGNLIVTGTTMYANVTNLDVKDLNITVAKGVATAAAADGAGLTVDTANVTWNYNFGTASWQSNVGITPASNNNLSLGTPNLVWANLHANNVVGANLYGTIQTASQPNITANNSTNFGGLSLATVQSQITGNAAIAYSNAVANAAALYQTTAGLSANVATLTSNNSTNFGGLSLATVQSQITGNAATAYSNAIAIAANATNLTTGTVNNARLPATIDVTTVNAATHSVGSIVVANSQGLTTSANVNIAATGELVIAPGAGIFANGGLGTAGQALLSNGSSVYWGPATTAVRQTFTSTAGQTTFTVSGGYTPNLLDVFYNGAKLINGTEVTVNNGTTVVLASGAANGATIDVVGYTASTLNILNAVAKSGDTMTGTLNLPSNGLTVGTTQLVVAGGNVGVGTGSPSSTLTIVGSLSTTNATTTSNTVTIGTAAYFVANGNVGIGTSAPVTPLHVISSITAGGTGNNGKLLGRNGSNTSVMDFGVAAGTAVANDVGLYNLTTTGDLVLGTNNTERMRISAGGNAAIGTSNTTSARLRVDTTGGQDYGRTNPNIFLTNTNDPGIRMLNTSNASLNHSAAMYVPSGAGGWAVTCDNNMVFDIFVDINGNFLARGNVTAYSDENLKEEISTIQEAVNTVSKLRGVTYKRRDTGSKGIGVIAQEVQTVIPEVVQQNGDYLSVAYGNMVGLLIEAIKEQQEKITNLESRINNLMGGSV